MAQSCPYQYLQWREQRRGFYTKWEEDMLMVAQALTRSEVGWIRQHPELLKNVRPIDGLIAPEEIEFAARDWHGACDAFHRHAANRSKEIQRVMRVHRDPFEPIMCILEADSPLAEYRKITASTRSASATPAANPPVPDPGGLRPPMSICGFAACRLRPVQPSLQSIGPERAAAGQFSYGAKAFEPVEQSGRRPAREIAAGRRGGDGVLIEKRLDDGARALGAHLRCGGAQRLGAPRNLAGGAQGRACSLDQSKADGTRKGRLVWAHAAPAPKRLEGGPVALAHQKRDRTIPSQQRGDHPIGQHPSERFGIRPHGMDGADQVRGSERRRPAGLQRVVGVVDRRNKSIVPGQPRKHPSSHAYSARADGSKAVYGNEVRSKWGLGGGRHVFLRDLRAHFSARFSTALLRSANAAWFRSKSLARHHSASSACRS